MHAARGFTLIELMVTVAVVEVPRRARASDAHRTAVAVLGSQWRLELACEGR